MRKLAVAFVAVVLVAIAAVTAVSRNLRIPDNLYDVAWRLWPVASDGWFKVASITEAVCGTG